MILRGQFGWPVVISAFLANMLLTAALFHYSEKVIKTLGKEGAKVIGKIFNLLLAALGVTLIVKGLITVFPGLHSDTVRPLTLPTEKPAIEAPAVPGTSSNQVRAARSEVRLTATRLEKDFKDKFPTDYELMLAMVGERVLADASLKDFYYKLISKEKHPILEKRAQYLASLLRMEDGFGEGDHSMTFEVKRGKKVIEKTIQYAQLEQDFLDWAVKNHIALREFPLAYSLYLQRVEEEKERHGPNTVSRVRAGNQMGNDIFERLREYRTESTRLPITIYKGDVISESDPRWIKDLNSNSALSKTLQDAGIKFEDLRMGIYDSPSPSDNGTYDIYLFTTNTGFIHGISKVVERHLPAVTPVGYAQITILAGVPTITAFQPRFFLPLTVEEDLRKYVEGSMRALGLLIEANLKDVLTSRNSVSQIRFLTPAYFLEGFKSRESTMQHYYLTIPRELGYSLKALPEPITGGYQHINFVFEKIMPVTGPSTYIIKSRAKPRGRSELRSGSGIEKNRASDPDLERYLAGKSLLHTVFEGGGAKGVAYVGALEEMELQNMWFKEVAGTSAGAITASLIAAGYTYPEIKKIVFESDFNQFKDLRWGIVPPWLNLAIFGGLYRGQAFETWIAGKLKDKLGFEPTLKDLPIPLSVVSSDISNKDMLILDKDTAPDLKVAEAVRMSMGIPFFFEVYRWLGTYKRFPLAVRRMVDGGLLSNFPLFIYDAAGSKGEPVVGFMLQEIPHKKEASKGWISKLLALLKYLPAFHIAAAVIDTALQGQDNRHIEDDVWAKIVNIPVDVGTLDFDLTLAQKEELAARGKEATEKILGLALRGGKGKASKAEVGKATETSMDVRSEIRARKEPLFVGDYDARQAPYGLKQQLNKGEKDLAQDLSQYFVHHGLEVGSADKIAVTLMRAGPAMYDLWEAWGTLSREQSEWLQSSQMSKIEGSKDFAERMQAFMTEYATLSEFKQKAAYQRLVPLAVVRQEVAKGTPEAVVFSLIRTRFSNFLMLDTIRKYVQSKKDEVGGTRNAWEIVVKQGYENAEEWMRQAKVFVEAYKDKVGGEAYAWRIAIAHGLKNAKAWVSKAQGFVAEHRGEIGESLAWRIVVQRGISEEEDLVTGKSLTGAERWFRNAHLFVEDRVRESPEGELSLKSYLWNTVITHGLEKGAAWFVAAKKIVEDYSDKVNGRTNAWQIVIRQGTVGVPAWIERAEKIVSKIQNKVGGVSNAWRLTINYGLDGVEKWVGEHSDAVAKQIEVGASVSRAWFDAFNNHASRSEARNQTQIQSEIDQATELKNGARMRARQFLQYNRELIQWFLVLKDARARNTEEAKEEQTLVLEKVRDYAEALKEIAGNIRPDAGEGTGDERARYQGLNDYAVKPPSGIRQEEVTIALTAESRKLKEDIEGLQKQFLEAHRAKDPDKLQKLNGRVVALYKARLKAQLLQASSYFLEEKVNETALLAVLTAVRIGYLKLSHEYGWRIRRALGEAAIQKIQVVGREGDVAQVYDYENFKIGTASDEKGQQNPVTIFQDVWVRKDLEDGTVTYQPEKKPFVFKDLVTAVRRSFHILLNQEVDFSQVYDRINDLDYTVDLLRAYGDEIPAYYLEDIQESVDFIMEGRRGGLVRGRVDEKGHAAANIKTGMTELKAQHVVRAIEMFEAAKTELETRLGVLMGKKAGISSQSQYLIHRYRRNETSRAMRELASLLDEQKFQAAYQLLRILYRTHYLHKAPEDSQYASLQRHVIDLGISLKRLATEKERMSASVQENVLHYVRDNIRRVQNMSGPVRSEVRDWGEDFEIFKNSQWPELAQEQSRERWARMAVLSKSLSTLLKGESAKAKAEKLEEMISRNEVEKFLLPEAERLIHSFLSIYRLEPEGNDPYLVGIEFSMYGEQNRLRPLSAKNPHGEDAIAAKLTELDELFSVNPRLTYKLLMVDDGERAVVEGASGQDELRFTILPRTMMRSAFWQWYVRFLSQDVRKVLMFLLHVFQMIHMESGTPEEKIEDKNSFKYQAVLFKMPLFREALAGGRASDALILSSLDGGADKLGIATDKQLEDALSRALEMPDLYQRVASQIKEAKLSKGAQRLLSKARTTGEKLASWQTSKLNRALLDQIYPFQKSSGEVALDILRERFPDRLKSGQAQVWFVNETQKAGIGGKKGSGILLGMRKLLELGAKIVIFTDADKAVHLGESGLLIGPLATGEAEAAIGSRWRKGGVVSGRLKEERRGSFIYNIFVRSILWLWQFRDTQCGFKAFTRKALEAIVPVDSQWQLDSDFTYDFAFDTHLLLRLRDLRKKVLEIPVVWIGSPDESTLRPESKVEAVLSLAKQRIPSERWQRSETRSLPQVARPVQDKNEILSVQGAAAQRFSDFKGASQGGETAEWKVLGANRYGDYVIQRTGGAPIVLQKHFVIWAARPGSGVNRSELRERGTNEGLPMKHGDRMTYIKGQYLPVIADYLATTQHRKALEALKIRELEEEIQTALLERSEIRSQANENEKPFMHETAIANMAGWRIRSLVRGIFRMIEANPVLAELPWSIMRSGNHQVSISLGKGQDQPAINFSVGRGWIFGVALAMTLRMTGSKPFETSFWGTSPNVLSQTSKKFDEWLKQMPSAPETNAAEAMPGVETGRARSETRGNLASHHRVVTLQDVIDRTSDFEKAAIVLRRIVEAADSGVIKLGTHVWYRTLPVVRRYLRAFHEKKYVPENFTVLMLLTQAMIAFEMLSGRPSEERRNSAKHTESQKQLQDRHIRESKPLKKKLQEVLRLISDPTFFTKSQTLGRELPQFDEPQIRRLEELKGEVYFTSREQIELRDIFNRFDRRQQALMGNFRSEVRLRQPLKAVVFDIGNVIVKFDFRKAAETLIRLGVRGKSVDEIANILLHSELNMNFERGRLSPEAFYKAVCKALDIHSISYEAFTEAWVGVFEPNLETIELIKRLKTDGYKIFLLSDTNPLHVEYLKRHHEFMGLADDVFTSYELRLRKGDGAEIFKAMGKKIEKKYALKLDELVFVDDRVENVEFSMAAGLPAFVFTGAQSAEVGIFKRSEVVGDADQLDNYIRELVAQINKKAQDGHEVSLPSVIKEPQKYEQEFYKQLYELFLARLSIDFDGAEEFVSYARGILATDGVKGLWDEMGRTDLPSSLALQYFRKIKPGKNTPQALVEFYGHIFFFLTKEMENYLGPVYDVIMATRPTIAIAREGKSYYSRAWSTIRLFDKEILFASDDAEKNYRLKRESMFDRTRLAERAEVTEAQRLRGAKVLKALEFWEEQAGKLSASFFRERIENFKQYGVVVAYGPTLPLIVADTEQNIFRVIHTDRLTNAFYFSTAYLDSLKIEDPEDMKELATWLNFGQEWLDIYRNIYGEHSEKKINEMADLDGVIAKDASKADSSEAAIAEAIEEERAKLNLHFFSAGEDIHLIPTAELQKRMAERMRAHVLKRYKDVMPLFFSEEEEAEDLVKKGQREGERDPFGQALVIYKRLLSRSEAMGMHTYTQRIFHKIIYATHGVQLYDKGGLYPPQMQMDLVLIAARLGQWQVLENELDILLTGRAALKHGLDPAILEGSLRQGYPMPMSQVNVDQITNMLGDNSRTSLFARKLRSSMASRLLATPPESFVEVERYVERANEMFETFFRAPFANLKPEDLAPEPGDGDDRALRFIARSEVRAGENDGRLPMNSAASSVDLGDAGKRAFLSVKPSQGKTAEDQIQSVFQNLDQMLKEKSLSKDDIFKQIVSFGDITDSERAKIKQALIRYYGTMIPPPATSSIEQSPADGSMFSVELSAAQGKDVRILRIDENISVVEDKNMLQIQLGGITPASGLPNAYEQSMDMLKKMRVALAKAEIELKRLGKIAPDDVLDYRQVLRIWFYQNEILKKDSNGKQRYQQLNDARFDYFTASLNGKAIPFGEGMIVGANSENPYWPASTGIGMLRGTMVMEGLAVVKKDERVRAVRLESPRQTNPFQYTSDVLVGGKKPPLWSRAMTLLAPGYEMSMVSGTASTKGQKVMYPGDPVRQTLYMISSVELLLQQRGASLRDIPQIRLYIKNPEHYAIIRTVIEKKFKNVPALYVIADVCRPDWLVEIEVQAFLPVKMREAVKEGAVAKEGARSEERQADTKRTSETEGERLFADHPLAYENLKVALEIKNRLLSEKVEPNLTNLAAHSRGRLTINQLYSLVRLVGWKYLERQGIVGERDTSTRFEDVREVVAWLMKKENNPDLQGRITAPLISKTLPALGKKSVTWQTLDRWFTDNEDEPEVAALHDLIMSTQTRMTKVQETLMRMTLSELESLTEAKFREQIGIKPSAWSNWKKRHGFVFSTAVQDVIRFRTVVKPVVAEVKDPEQVAPAASPVAELQASTVIAVPDTIPVAALSVPKPAAPLSQQAVIFPITPSIPTITEPVKEVGPALSVAEAERKEIAQRKAREARRVKGWRVYFDDSLQGPTAFEELSGRAAKALYRAGIYYQKQFENTMKSGYEIMDTIDKLSGVGESVKIEVFAFLKQQGRFSGIYKELDVAREPVVVQKAEKSLESDTKKRKESQKPSIPNLPPQVQVSAVPAVAEDSVLAQRTELASVKTQAPLKAVAATSDVKPLGKQVPMAEAQLKVSPEASASEPVVFKEAALRESQKSAMSAAEGEALWKFLKEGLFEAYERRYAKVLPSIEVQTWLDPQKAVTIVNGLIDSAEVVRKRQKDASSKTITRLRELKGVLEWFRDAAMLAVLIEQPKLSAQILDQPESVIDRASKMAEKIKEGKEKFSNPPNGFNRALKSWQEKLDRLQEEARISKDDDGNAASVNAQTSESEFDDEQQSAFVREVLEQMGVSTGEMKGLDLLRIFQLYDQQETDDLRDYYLDQDMNDLADRLDDFIEKMDEAVNAADEEVPEANDPSRSEVRLQQVYRGVLDAVLLEKSATDPVAREFTEEVKAVGVEPVVQELRTVFNSIFLPEAMAATMLSDTKVQVAGFDALEKVLRQKDLSRETLDRIADQMFNQTLKDLAESIQKREIGGMAPVVFYSPEMKARLIRFIETVQQGFDAIGDVTGENYRITLVSTNKAELMKLKAELSKRGAMRGVSFEENAKTLSRNVFENPRFKDQFGVFFPENDLGKNVAWQRLVRSEIPKEYGILLLPALSKYFATVSTSQISATTLRQALPDLFASAAFRVGQGIAIVATFLEHLAAAERQYAIAA